MSATLRPLTAAAELRVLRRAPCLLPYLLSQGLSPEDAWSLAHNAALLSCALKEKLSPRMVLDRFSLSEIAALCEAYRKETAAQQGSLSAFDGEVES